MNFKTKALVVGIMAGAALGAVLALAAADTYEEEEDVDNPLATLGAGDYFQLGISILTIARQLGGMLKRA